MKKTTTEKKTKLTSADKKQFNQLDMYKKVHDSLRDKSTFTDVSQIISSYVDEIIKSVSQGYKVKIAGLGVIMPKYKKERVFQSIESPKDGKKKFITSPERLGVVFRVSKSVQTNTNANMKDIMKKMPELNPSHGKTTKATTKTTPTSSTTKTTKK